MDPSIFYDDKLTKIKQFNIYLKSIIDNGYNNNIDKLSLILKHINNLNYELIKLSIDSNYGNHDTESEPEEHSAFTFYSADKTTYKSSAMSSDSSSDNEETEEDLIKLEKEKQFKKINDFIKNSDDLSKIYIYNKKNNYMNEIKQFIKNTFEY